ncbi:MAG: hypothetical protein EHM39_02325, partial [Chloroflexi bacterium]
VVYFLVILFRGSLPRFRLDQMMDLNWKVFTPLALASVMVLAIVSKALEAAPEIVQGAALLAANLVIAIGALQFMRASGRRQREQAKGTLVVEDLEAQTLHEHPSI